MLLATAMIVVLNGKGFLTDGSHPKRPGDFQRHEAKVRIEMDREAGIAAIAIETGEGETKDVDRYFVRRGRTFQVDDKGEEVPAKNLGDLTVPAIAALHPALVVSALAERSEHVRDIPGGIRLFAWNDVLWTLTTADKGETIVGMSRNALEDVGRRSELVDFSRSPDRVTVAFDGRRVAEFTFERGDPVTHVDIPKGDERRDQTHVIEAREITFKEIAPHLFTIDLSSTNSRVFVVESTDHLVVLEGAYGPRNGRLIARAIKTRFGKPVRFHAFSHMHGQYVGSTRSWVEEKATILVPPTTVPLIEKLAVGLGPLLKVETVASTRKLEDATNVLEIHNVPSEHTDEYFVFWFPGPRVLLTGDLLFYRPGKALTGRSKRLCQTVAELGLDVDRCVATWPLEGYGTENIVTGAQLEAACAPAP